MDLIDPADENALRIVLVSGDNVQHPVDPVTAVYKDRASVVKQQFAGLVAAFEGIAGAVFRSAVSFRFGNDKGALMPVRMGAEDFHADHSFGYCSYILLKETAVHHSI